MLGDYIPLGTIRAAAILTNSFVAGTIIGPSNAVAANNNVADLNQLILYIDFTIGSLTDAQIKIEFAHDGVTPDYYQEAASSIASGIDTVSALVHKFTATGKYRLAIPIKDNYIKVSAVGTGTVTSSSMKISAVIGQV